MAGSFASTRALPFANPQPAARSPQPAARSPQFKARSQKLAAKSPQLAARSSKLSAQRPSQNLRAPPTPREYHVPHASRTLSADPRPHLSRLRPDLRLQARPIPISKPASGNRIPATRSGLTVRQLSRPAALPLQAPLSQGDRAQRLHAQQAPLESRLPSLARCRSLP